MSIEPETEGRIPSIIGIIRKLVSEDPLLALVAVVILFPVGAAIASASLTGNFDVIPILLATEAATIIFCCIPLIITKTYKQTQTDLRTERKTAITTESKTRVMAETNKQQRLNELVAAQIDTLKAKQSFILGQSLFEDREIFRKTMEELHELLKSGKSIFVSQADFTNTIQKILEDLAGIYQELEIAKTSTIDGPVAIKQETPQAIEDGSIEDIQHQLDNYKANYESLETRYNHSQKINEEYRADIELHNKNYLDLQTEFDRYKASKETPVVYPPKLDELKITTHGEHPELNLSEEEDEFPDEPLKEALSILDNLEDKENDGIVDRVKSVIESVKDGVVQIVPSALKKDEEIIADPSDFDDLPQQVFTENDIPDDIRLEISEEEKAEGDLICDHGIPFKQECQECQSLEQPQAAKIPPPKSWPCLKCKRDNDLKKVRCPACGSPRPR